MKSKCRHKFSVEEDQNLMMLVKKFGERSKWKNIAKKMSGRDSRQCRDRWKYYLSPQNNADEWTDDEDLKLLNLYNMHGRKWSSFKRCFPGRTTVNIKSRWYYLDRHKFFNSALLFPPTNQQFEQIQQQLCEQSIQPQSIQPQSIQPQSIQPQSIQPQSIQQQSIQQQSIQQQSIQQQSIQQQSIQPQSIQQQSIQPQSIQQQSMQQQSMQQQSMQQQSMQQQSMQQQSMQQQSIITIDNSQYITPIKNIKHFDIVQTGEIYVMGNSAEQNIIKRLDDHANETTRECDIRTEEKEDDSVIDLQNETRNNDIINEQFSFEDLQEDFLNGMFGFDSNLI